MKKTFKKKANWNLVSSLSIFSIFVLFMLTLLLFLGIGEIMRGYSNFGKIALCFASVVILVLLSQVNTILWQIRGQEVVHIDNERLVIKKKKKLFNSQKSINLLEIDEIFFEPYPEKLFTASAYFKWMGIRGGKICVEYRGRNAVYIGQNISDDEAKKCIEEMNAKLSEYNKQHPQDRQKRKIKRVLGFPIMSLENITTLMSFLFVIIGLTLILLAFIAVHRGMMG